MASVTLMRNHIRWPIRVSRLVSHQSRMIYQPAVTSFSTLSRIQNHKLLPKKIPIQKLLCSSMPEPSSLLDMEANTFTQFLKANNIQRCFVINDPVSGEPVVSHPQLQEFADYFRAQSPDYRSHEGVFLEVGSRTDCLLAVFIWNTNRGQACGGVRLWRYPSMENFLMDGLRLAHGMGVKSALAGLWAGGGQGVLAEPLDKKHLWPEFRQYLFYDFGDFLTSLNGCFVAAEDVGLSINDMDSIHQRTRYTTCISQDIGGSGSSGVATAYGVASAMEGALDFLHMGDLSDKSIAIQGCGHVATTLIGHLLDKKVGEIFVTDCNQLRVEDTQDIFSHKAHGRLRVEKVPMDDMSIMNYPCDILSPCALGNCLNSQTIPGIQARIVCGAANNQLGSDDDNQLLADLGIAYVVDFLANRMGIVNCTGEAYGRLPDDQALSRHFSLDWENSIFQMTKKILQRAADDDITPHKAALALAELLVQQQHPVWPNRGRHIIQSLVRTGWHQGNDFWRTRRGYAGYNY